MRVCAALLLSILVFAATAPDPALVASIEKKLRHVESNGAIAQPDPSPTDMTEQEINAYFASGRIKLPDGVQSVRFVGMDGAITAVARVDFDRIRSARKTSNPLLSVFSGVNDVEVQAHARGSAGKGLVQVDSVALNGVEIPRFILELFVEKYVQPKHPEIGMDSRFDLPDRIATAAVGKHTLRLTQQ